MKKSLAIDSMVCAMARQIRNGDVVTTGVASALPMLAIGLARATYAPRLLYLNCVGAVNPSWEKLPPTSVDPALLPGQAFIRLEEIWEMANRGCIDLMFFGAFQIDARGRTNLHWLASGKKLPGIAGASTMRWKVKEPVLFTVRHDPRTLVPEVDAVTTSPRPDRESRLITPLAILSLGPTGARLQALLPGHTLEEVTGRSGFPIAAPSPPESLPPPSAEEKQALERLDPEGLREQFF